MSATQLASGDKIPGTRLTYLHETTRTNPRRRRAEFLCDCGTTISADVNYVRYLQVTSCGCYRSEVVAQKNTKHSHAVGGDPTGTYRSWQAMHQRVKTDSHYQNVPICTEWYDFENFLKDMGERPDNHTIERKDGTLGYAPGNCKWATWLEQAQNTKNTVKVTIGTETHSINEWCRRMGIGYHVVKQRRARGMSIEDAITTPINTSKQGRKRI